MGILNDEQQLRQQLNLQPDDWQLRLVYADCLEEQGKELLAKGQRWQAENKKYPNWFPNVYFWYNGVTLDDKITEYFHEYLKKSIYDALNDEEGFIKEYLSQEEAETDLAQALYEAGEV